MKEKYGFETAAQMVQDGYIKKGGKNRMVTVTIRPSEAQMELDYIHLQEELERERKTDYIAKEVAETRKKPEIIAVKSIDEKGRETTYMVDKDQYKNDLRKTIEFTENLLRETKMSVEEFEKQLRIAPTKDLKEILDKIERGE